MLGMHSQVQGVCISLYVLPCVSTSCNQDSGKHTMTDKNVTGCIGRHVCLAALSVYSFYVNTGILYKGHDIFCLFTGHCRWIDSQLPSCT